jgi:serine/threonine-protein kinase
VGEYLLESLVGVGGMARVYRARSADGREVAVKLVKEEYALNEIFRRRFEREAHIARTVIHPHVVPVLESGEYEGLPYLVQPYIEGQSLDEKIKHDGRLDPETTARICGQVAQGLQALSEAGMIHRDVKPANILLDAGETAYVTDFGLAKDTQDSALTEPGQSMGSLAYMAPEQIRGEVVTASADIYSLGCVAFECVQGKPPFADREGMRVLWAHLQDEPPDPTGPPAPPAEFTRALKAALRKTPEERPATCVQYAQALSESVGVELASIAS